MGATTECALAYFGLFSLVGGCTRLTSQSVSLSLSRDPVITKGSVGGESQLHPLGVLDGHAGSRGHHRHGCSYENRGRQSTLAEYRVTCPGPGTGL